MMLLQLHPADIMGRSVQWNHFRLDLKRSDATVSGFRFIQAYAQSDCRPSPVEIRQRPFQLK